MAFDAPALSGTLADLRPRTLLHFLGLTGKSGVLRVQGRDRAGAVWLQGGRVVAAGIDGSVPVVAGVVDVLRLPNGRFAFDEQTFTVAGPGRPVTEVLEDAADVLAEWEDVSQAVPSSTLRVRLVQAAGEGRLSSDGWALSVAVAGGHATPAGVAAHLRWDLLRACRAVKELVDAGRAELEVPQRPARRLDGATAVLTAADTVVPAGRGLWPGAGESDGARWRSVWHDEAE